MYINDNQLYIKLFLSSETLVKLYTDTTEDIFKKEVD